jgi:hypothetical protein
MSAPTYREFLHTPMPVRLGHRWSWHVGDGYLTILGDGTTFTRWGAMRARDRFARTCRTPMAALLADLDAAIRRLRDAGIDVTARIDERGRVCVRSECACSDRDHRRVMREFLALTTAVLWVPGTEVQPQGQATVSDSPTGGEGR